MSSYKYSYYHIFLFFAIFKISYILSRRGECRQLVRMCEQRRQEALAASARARRGAGAAAALDALARRLHALTEAVRAAYQLPAHVVHPTVFHNEAYCRYVSETCVIHYFSILYSIVKMNAEKIFYRHHRAFIIIFNNIIQTFWVTLQQP